MIAVRSIVDVHVCVQIERVDRGGKILNETMRLFEAWKIIFIRD